VSTTYLIKNASVLGGEAADLLLRDGIIAEVGSVGSVRAEGAVEIDAAGLIALPGLVDLHTHLREPGREDAETVDTGTRAAALGGFTAVHAMANTDPVADTAGVVEQVWRLGREAGHCDVFPVGAVTVGLRGERLAELGAMADSAARVRVFSDDGKCVSDAALMRRALEYVKAFDGVVAQHAQEPRLTEGAQMNEGELSGVLGLAGWPAVAEEAIIARDILLAAHTESRLHICHVSTAGSVDLVLDLADGPTWLGRAAFADPRVPRISIVPHPSVTPAEIAATIVAAERTHPAPYLDYEILAPGPLALTRLVTALFGPGRHTVGVLPAAGAAYPGAVSAGDGAGLARLIDNSPDLGLGRPRRYLLLDTRPDQDGRLDIRTAIPVQAAGRPLPRAGRSPLSVAVLDASGTVLSTHHLHGTDAIEWDGRAAELAFDTGARLAVGRPPTARLAAPRVRAGVIHTAWISRHPREEPHVVALYSADDGATWRPVGFSRGTEGSVDLATDSVPGGSRCRLRIIASAELASVDLISAPFAVPLTPREVTIVWLDGQLAGSAYSPDAGVCPPDELHWASDLDGDLGTGRQPAVPPGPGRHRITATAPDGTGRRCTATARVTLRG